MSPAPARHLVGPRLWAGIAALLAAGVVWPQSASASASTYHVAPSGSDANPGTAALPFQHIQKCADVMVAGDTCLVGSGRYRETVTPQNSGTATAPITYAPEPGATVTVDGSEVVSGWSQVTSVPSTVNGVPDPFLSQSPFATAVSGGSVYSAHVVIPQTLLGSDVLGMVRTTADPHPQLFYNNQMMMTAQYPAPPPDHDPMHPEVAVLQDGSTPTTIMDPKLTQPPGYWVGASVYMAFTDASQTLQVTASVPGALTVCCWVTPVQRNTVTGDTLSGGANVGCPEPTPGYLNTRYMLYNKLESLAGPGDWFYDSSSQTLYFDSPTNASPAAGAVTVKQRQLAFDLETNNISYTTLDGLNVFGSTIRTGPASTNNTLDHLDVNYPSYFLDITADPNMAGLAAGSPIAMDFCNSESAGATTSGVVLRGHDNVIQNSTVQNSAGNGIVLWNSNPICVGGECASTVSPDPGNRATNNVIRNVDFAGSVSTAAVLPLGDNNTIDHNTMVGCGRSCVTMMSFMTGQAVHNLRISYNDMSGHCRLLLDCGAIYSLVGQDFSGSRIDHNWVHDAEPLTGIGNPAAVGIYIDGSGSNIQIDNNVGWNNVRGLLAFNYAGAGNPQYGLKVYNNSGGGYLSIAAACDANGQNCSEFVNNLGFINTTVLSTPDPKLVVSHNYPPAGPDPVTGIDPPGDPLYVDARVADYRLQAGSPGRNAAQPIAGVTDGSTDATPSLGAYQYGAPRWVPGATVPSSEVNLHYAPNADLGTTGGGQWADTATVVRPADHTTRTHATIFGVSDFTGNTGTLRVGYLNPVANPTDPMFAQLSNLAIDKVQVWLYARSYNHSAVGAFANVHLSGPTGSLWDANNESFDHTGGLRIDISDKVAGNWNNLPAWIDVTATLNGPAVGGIFGAVTQANSTALYLHTVELDVRAHCINPAAAPCAPGQQTGPAVSARRRS